MNLKHKKAALTTLAFIFVIAGFAHSGNRIKFENNVYSIECTECSMTELFKELKDKYGISIVTMDTRIAESLNFSIHAATKDALIMKLASSIPGAHPAFVYDESRIEIIYFLPESRNDLSTAISEKVQSGGKRLGARVTSIPPKSSLPWADLKVGDIIIEYDHIPVQNGPVELASFMKNKSAKDLIELKVLREGYSIDVFAFGGFLDAGLKTVSLENMVLKE